MFSREGRHYILYHRHRVPYVPEQAFRQTCVDEFHFTPDGLMERIVPTHAGPKFARSRSSGRLPATAAASTELDSLHPAGRALDENLATRWAPAATARGGWLSVDFGRATAIGRIEIRFEYAWKPYRFALETSSDGALNSRAATKTLPARGAGAQCQAAMNTRLLSPLLACVASGASWTEGASDPFARGRWIDLTHDFSSETLYWPTSDRFRLETVFEGVTEGGFYYSAYKFCAAEHGGTHLDAPVHFAQGRMAVEEIPLEQLIGPAVVVDIAAKALVNRDYQVVVDDFAAWEEAHAPFPDGAIVLLRTGYGRYWPDAESYLGTAKRGPEAVAELHFPGLHPDAARWLVANRAIKAIGLDTPSIDFGQSKLFESHQVLFAANIPAFENVANLEQLPATGAHVIALPMKIKGGSGAPLRIVALLPEN